jgi:hypothetical protein
MKPPENLHRMTSMCLNQYRALISGIRPIGGVHEPRSRIESKWCGRRFAGWLERGEPPVTPPARHGFGSVPIEKIMAQDFGVHAKIDFAPEGLRYEFDVALSALAPEAIATKA